MSQSSTTLAPEVDTRLDYITATAVALSKGGGFGDTETNKCAAEAYVSAIGVGTLRDRVTPAEIAAKPNVLPKDFGLKADDAKLYRGLNDCVDVDAVVLANYASDEAVIDCLESSTPEELRYSLFESSLAGQPPEPGDDAAVKAALAKCPPSAPPPGPATTVAPARPAASPVTTAPPFPAPTTAPPPPPTTPPPPPPPPTTAAPTQAPPPSVSTPAVALPPPSG